MAKRKLNSAVKNEVDVLARVQAVTGSICALLGGVMMFAWHSGNYWLLQITPHSAPIQYNTALCFLLSGIAMLLLARESFRLIIPFGLIVAVIGGLTILQYAQGIDYGIDQFFVSSDITTGISHPGRMGLNTAICFVLIGVEIIILSAVWHRWIWIDIASILGGVTAALGATSLFGYGFGIPSAYGWGKFTSQMAIVTAFGFVVLGTGFTLFSWRFARISSLYRVPATITLIGLTLTLCWWQALRAQEQTALTRSLEIGVIAVESETAQEIRNRILALERMAGRWARRDGGMTQQDWAIEAGTNIRHFSGFQAIGWADEDLTLRWVVRKDGSFASINQKIDGEDVRRTSVAAAISNRKTTFTPIVESSAGSQGFVFYTPIFSGDNFGGFIIGSFFVDDFFNSALAAQLKNDFDITVEESGREIYRSSAEIGGVENAARKNVEFPDLNWAVNVFPKAETLSLYSTKSDEAALIAGIFVSLLVGLAVYLAQRGTNEARYLKNTQKSLRESEEQLRSLVSSGQDGIFSCDSTGKIVFWNFRAELDFGYSSDEAIGRPLQMMLPEKYFKLNKVILRRFANAKYLPLVGQTIELEGRRKNGEVFPIEVSLSGWETSKGRFFTGFVRDVSRRSEIEAALRQSEEHFRSVVSSAQDAIVSADSEGRILSWNKNAERLFGHTEAQAIGKPLTLLMPERYRQAHIEGMRRYAATNQSRVIGKTVELQGLHKEGIEFPIELSLGVWQSHDEKYFTGFIRDITTRKMLERELEEARDAALESAQMKSEFLANMSHEIRTPMNGVIGMSGLLLDSKLDPRQRQYAETVRDSGEALLTIINDILDFSKIEAGKLDIEIHDFDLRETIESTIELFTDRARERGNELTNLIYSNVKTALRGDAGRLRQILTNLIGNAVKFTRNGEIIVRVRRERENKRYSVLRFSVSDTGVGISDEAKDRLFQSFVQADASTTRNFGGTGLGLTISKKLVELMNGEIGFTSALGIGSSFWFTARFEKQPVGAASEQKSLKGVRVLIVDESPINREVLRNETYAMGMISSEAGSADDAVKKVLETAEPFDLLLMDMNMRDKGAVETARLINEKGALPKIVIVASNGQRGDCSKAEKAGFAAYLSKPFRQKELINCLAAVMSDDNMEFLTKFTLPQIQQTEETKETEKPVERRRILVVEDNPINQTVARTQINQFGYQADVAANGMEALELISRIPYDLVLMDCQMPEMDGFDATRAIRSKESNDHRLPIIAMTAHAFPAEREKCLAAGMDDFLSKPVRKETLRAKIEEWTKMPKPSNGFNKSAAAGKKFSSAAVDLKCLAEISEGDADFKREIVTRYLKETSDLLAKLKSAVKSNDAAAVYQTAHKLAGSSATCGMTAIVDPLRKLEQMGKSGRLDDTEKEIKTVLAGFRKIKKECKTICNAKS